MRGSAATRDQDFGLMPNRRPSKQKVRVPAMTPTGFSCISAVSPARYIKFEKSMSDLLNVKDWAEKKDILNLRGEQKLYDKVPDTRRDLTGILSKRNGLEDIGKHYRPKTSKEAKIRRLQSTASLDDDSNHDLGVSIRKKSVETRIAEIITGQNLRMEIEDPEPLPGFRHIETPFTDIDVMSERLPQDVVPRVITVILAGEEKPRKSIQLYLHQRNFDNLRQVVRGVSDVLTPHNAITSLYGAITRCEVYSLGDLYQEDNIFIGFTRTDSDMLMSQFTLHPKEVQTVRAYRSSSFSPSQRITLRTPIFPSPISRQTVTDLEWLSKPNQATEDCSRSMLGSRRAARSVEGYRMLENSRLNTAKSTVRSQPAASRVPSSRQITHSPGGKQKAYKLITHYTLQQKIPLNNAPQAQSMYL